MEQDVLRCFLKKGKASFRLKHKVIENRRSSDFATVSYASSEVTLDGFVRRLFENAEEIHLKGFTVFRESASEAEQTELAAVRGLEKHCSRSELFSTYLAVPHLWLNGGYPSLYQCFPIIVTRLRHETLALLDDLLCTGSVINTGPYAKLETFCRSVAEKGKLVWWFERGMVMVYWDRARFEPSAVDMAVSVAEIPAGS